MIFSSSVVRVAFGTKEIRGEGLTVRKMTLSDLNNPLEFSCDFIVHQLLLWSVYSLYK